MVLSSILRYRDRSSCHEGHTALRKEIWGVMAGVQATGALLVYPSKSRQGIITWHVPKLTVRSMCFDEYKPSDIEQVTYNN